MCSRLAALIGDEATEMIQGYTVARVPESAEAESTKIVFPYPKQSEAMHEAVLAACGRALHI